MMNHFIDFIGTYWLTGAKYNFSRFLAGSDWDLDIETALNRFNLSLGKCNTLQDIDKYFKGKLFWTPDPLFQAWDIIYPPIQMLARGGEDCDGFAMLNAEAITYVLGNQGWKAYTVSYLADPFTESHHFAIGVDPKGQVWVMQPQPSKQQFEDPYWKTTSCVFGPYPTVDKAVKAIVEMYKTKIVFYVVKGPRYEALSKEELKSLGTGVY